MKHYWPTWTVGRASGARKIRIHFDSQPVVGQMSGEHETWEELMIDYPKTAKRQTTQIRD